MFLLLVALTALLPEAPPDQPAAVPDAPAISARLERRFERFDYHFDNESNVEPGPLVPHFFEQRYDATASWLFVKADYRLTGLAASTDVGVAPTVTVPGSDIDTFFQTNGDVITSGTRGMVDLRSFSVQQRLELSSWRLTAFSVTGSYRRSRMDFLPSDRIVTHTQPPAETRQPVPGHETTWSQVIESGITAHVPMIRGSRWQVLATIDALPLVSNLLSVSLPDKYPGRTIRFGALGFAARGRLAGAYRAGRVDVGAAVTVGGGWGYRETSDYHERRAGVEGLVVDPPPMTTALGAGLQQNGRPQVCAPSRARCD